MKNNRFIVLLYSICFFLIFSFDSIYSQETIYNRYTIDDRKNLIHISRLLNVEKDSIKKELDTIYVKKNTEYKDIHLKFFYKKNNNIIELFPDIVEKNITIFMGVNCIFDSLETIERKLESNTHYNTGYIPYITNYYENSSPNFKPYDSTTKETILVNPDRVLKYSEKQIQNNTIMNIYILMNSGSDKGDDYFLFTRFYLKVL